MIVSIRGYKILLVVLCCVILFVSALPAQRKAVTILHTNDIHADFIPHEATRVKTKPRPLIGGFNELYYAVDSLRRVKNSTLLLDAGDIMSGNPITEYEYRGAEGGALIEMMNLVGYDAWTFGNHEFDISQDNLCRLLKIAKFSGLGANITDTAGRPIFQNSSYLIIEKNGLRIGIIGIMSNQFNNLVDKRGREGVVILSPVAALQKIIDQLRPSADLIVSLTHEGVSDDSVLAMNVKGLDVIVGGHSHSNLKHPKIVNGVIIVQTGSNCENLGILDLIVENRHVIEYESKLLPLWCNSTREPVPISKFIDSVKNRIDDDYSGIVGTLKTDWIRRKGESNIGNFIADAQMEAAGADFGIMNNGGIRKDVTSGPVSKKDLFEILPFRDMLTKFEISGQQIREIIRFEIIKGPAIQTSGIRCRWRYNADGEIEFESLFVNGKPLDDEKIYIGAASDYLAGELPKYVGFDIPKVTCLNITVLTAIEKKIRSIKEISSVIEHRIKRVK